MVWEFTNQPNNGVWAEIGLDIRDGEISVRDEIVQCLAKHGHEVYLRSPTEQRCSCFKEDQFDDFNPECSDCNGFGYYYVDRKIRAYRRPAFGTFGFTGATVRSPLGDISAADTVWYFPSTAKVSIGYIIVEVITDDQGNVYNAEAPKIERKHAIKLAHLYRERLGRKEYWAVLAREMKLGK